MALVFIGVGSNMGDRLSNSVEALRRMASGIRILAVSSLYETEPHHDPSQPLYLNFVVKGETEMYPRGLLTFLQGIERDMGRKGKRDGLPRVIDLDILLYGDEIIRMRDLTIPHPLLHRRGFVLTPLSELDPGLRHPVLGRRVIELLEDLKDGKMVRPYLGRGWWKGLEPSLPSAKDI